MSVLSPQVVLYTTRFCPYCTRARALLVRKGVEFNDIPVDADPERRAEMQSRSGRRTVPQIWIGDCHVGGFDELAALEREGRLDELLQRAPGAGA
ncbi:glutaredoxin [Haliea atlantica]|jgi:glutaredoxin 3|nr:glutaredoxin 3 [Haliea sp.]MAL95161.1 glutaredoxin 3 [Haliea sp.]|tara:strand:+ start:693 stop:977 length:285 start_codon:yes stop_codon:yes gene_type:complete